MDNMFGLAEKIVFFITISFLIFYLPRLRCWLQPLKKQKRLVSDKEHKLALIIPARNEIKAIKPLLSSINRQSYSKDNFDFYVLVKDENDPTIPLVKENGGYVHIIPEQTCKGDALDASMQRILKTDPYQYDAFIVVDADCILDEHFLREMNNSLASGAKVVNSKKVVKNYLSNSKSANSVWSACNGLIWPLMDDLGNRYKSDNGITTMTIGTGLMLTADLIRSLGGWPYRETLTEDIELMYDCMYRDIPTFYYSYAVLYVEESTSLSVTNKRRTRWLTGVVDSKRIYSHRIKSKAHTGKGFVDYYFTTALSLVYGFVGLISLMCIVNLAISVFLLLCTNHWWLNAFYIAEECFIIIYSAFFALTVACMIVDRKNIKLSFIKKLAVLLVHPVFYMGYIPIIARALLFRKNKGWEVIDRVDFGDIKGEELSDQTANTH